jgi:hypothetical protein
MICPVYLDQHNSNETQVTPQKALSRGDPALKSTESYSRTRYRVGFS